MTTLELVQYYANLLILQYVGKDRAYATIRAQVTPIVQPQVSTQEIVFSAVAASGAFVLEYDGFPTASISWNDSSSTIESKLQAISGLGSITVSGSIASQSLIVTFTGVDPVADIITVGTNTLLTAGSAAVSITVDETDITLPFAVQNAFNLIGSDTAVGVNLEALGKYAGVTRSGYGLDSQPITLDDADFLVLIQFAAITNNSGSSLEEIQSALVKFFPDEVLVFDYKTMHMSYLISSAIGSQDLIQLVVTENLLPKPMGVQLSIVVAPVITSFFGFRTYDAPAFNAKPFNTYDSYNTSWSWLTYADGIST